MDKILDTKSKPSLEISVVMAAYNDEKNIAQSIESILDQSFDKFEFIIINDCCADNTGKIIEKFSQQDKRITVLKNDKNIGLTKSLNKGIKVAKGKYIARQDADDISLPNRLQTQYNFLENNPGIFLCGSAFYYIDKNGETIGTDKKRMKLSEQELVKKIAENNQLIHSSWFFRSKGVYYREKFYYAQDYDFILNLLIQKKRIFLLSHKLIKWRINPSAISYTQKSKQDKFSRIARESYLQRRKNGSDIYDQFCPHDILSQKNSDRPDRSSIEENIILLIKNGKTSKARKLYSENFKIITKNSMVQGIILLFFTYVPLTYKLYSKIRYG